MNLTEQWQRFACSQIQWIRRQQLGFAPQRHCVKGGAYTAEAKFRPTVYTPV